MRTTNILKYALPIISIVCFIACSTGSKKETSRDKSLCDSTQIKYAEGFNIFRSRDYVRVTVNDPWTKGGIYARYYLVKEDSTTIPTDGVKVKIPLRTLISASATHYEFLSLLDEINSLTGICMANLVYNPSIRKACDEGKIVDLGDSFRLDPEKVLQLYPNALMMSGYSQVDPNAQRISQAGIPVIYNNEWTETSLLGRAEWIKFVAAFYDKSAMADSIFNKIEIRYNEVKQKALQVPDKPDIMSGSNFRGTWYMPAGHSFMGKLYADAGGSYFYANDTTTGSLPLNIESVLRDFADADVWLNCNFNSTKELIADDAKNALFKAAKTGNIYNFHKRMLPSGANDFWESAVARPDLLLSDVIAILHPEIIPGYELYYAQKISDN